MKRGQFIVIDGPDGAGKTTLIVGLMRRLAEADLLALQTREPGGTPYAEKIRELILSAEGGKAHPLTMQYLFNAARAQHVFEKILPALERGEHVVCDRFDSTTYAYQIEADRWPQGKRLFTAMRAQYKDIVRPYYIYLDVSPEVGRARLEGRTDKLNHFDERPLEWHGRARQGFKDFLNLFCGSGSFSTVSAEQAPEVVLKEVFAIVQGVLKA